jgi:hypothetical protein
MRYRILYRSLYRWSQVRNNMVQDRSLETREVRANPHVAKVKAAPYTEMWRVQSLGDGLNDICTNKKRTYSMALVRERTIPTERPQLVGEISPTFADRGCFVVSTVDPHSRIRVFLDRSRYCFFHVAPQLHSRGWVDPVPDPLLLRTSDNAGNLTWDVWICSQKLGPLDHRGGEDHTDGLKKQILRGQ